jgi:serine/threonine-protein kinase
VGPFQLIERLPRSREVREFLARQRGPGGFERICALKLANRDASDQRAAQALEREAKVMMRLDHPNVVRFHDFFEQDDKIVLVLEHFSGLTLARFLELLSDNGQHLDERITWHVALSLFEALAHAHGLSDVLGSPAPIIHRDIRPGNVLISSDGRVRLTGFSSAQDADSNEEITAPEQVRGVETTDRSDAFAAALIIWEMLSHRSATPEGLSEFDLLKHLSQRRVESLRLLRPDIPALVTTALDLCLASDPDERRIHCEEVAGCINAGLDPGDGPLAVREAISRLGPAVEKLAGGVSNSAPPSRRRLGSSPPLPHRSEAITLPDRVRISARMEAAVTAVPRAPGARPVLPEILPSANSPLPDLVEIEPLAEVEPLPHEAPPAPPPQPSSPAPAFVSSEPPLPAYPQVDTFGDDDLSLMRASQKRRQVVRFAVLGIPITATAVIAAVALSGGLGGTHDVPAPPPPKPMAAPTEALPSSDEHPEPDHVASTASLAKPASNEAVLIVEGPPEGFVYVTGKSIGATGTPIVTECGQRFIRVGTRMGPQGLSSVRWLADGQSVRLPCGKTTTVRADPNAR